MHFSFQTQTQPGRPKKNKGQEVAASPAAGTSSYGNVKPEYPYQYPAYPYPAYAGAYCPPAHDPALPINLSSDASLDLSTERRPPLPGKKLILETYQREAPRARDHSDYLPKKMRAAESLARAAGPAETSSRADLAFLEDPKNAPSRSESTAAAPVRGRREAASATSPTTERERRPECCALECLGAGVICDNRHSEILNRERVSSICGMDKHALDDYLHEGAAHDHDEELLQYFQRDAETDVRVSNDDFLETAPDPRDDRSRGKSEKLSQLRELLAKNLKNQSGSSSRPVSVNQEKQYTMEREAEVDSHNIFKTVNGTDASDTVNGHKPPEGDGDVISETKLQSDKNSNMPYSAHDVNALLKYAAPYNVEGNGQSPATRAQQYDFVPISDGSQSPPRRSPPPASPFVSPRNTPAPRSRLCSRPIPKHNPRRRRGQLSIDGSKQFAVPNEQKFLPKYTCGMKYCQPMSAPPSPNILCPPYKTRMHHAVGGIPNGATNLNLNFLPNMQFSEQINGDHSQPLSADPLSSEVSQFFQESIAPFAPETSFRSQSVPLKQALCNINMLSYNNTPVGSVPPTPVPHEFSDFGSLAETCDISKACLNPESLDKIYDAIDSSNDVLDATASATLMNAGESLTNGCDQLAEQQILTDTQLNSLIGPDGRLLDRGDNFGETFAESGPVDDNVEELLKRGNGIEFNFEDLEMDKNKYYVSRSVPSTPLPAKRPPPILPPEARRTRGSFSAESYTLSNGITSKSVPSTPQLADDGSVFSYSNRDLLINGNSVETVMTRELHSPLHDMMLAPLTPAADLLPDLGPPYADI